MTHKSLAVLSAAALLIAVTYPAAASDRDSAQKTRTQAATGVQKRNLDARTRDANDAWRPEVPAAALDEAARYRGTVPQIAGH